LIFIYVIDAQNDTDALDLSARMHKCTVGFKLSGQIMEERPEPTSSQSFLYAQNFLNHSADSKLVKLPVVRPIDV